MENADGTLGHTSFVGDANVAALHRLLWTYQEEIGDFFSATQISHKTVGRRVSTLLAQIGPPEHKATESQWAMELSSSKFEEIMAKHTERAEFSAIKNLNIFYQAGNSRAGNPVSKRFI